MSNNKPEYGVINEQGFVAGNGLGFNPFDEAELDPNSQNENSDDKSMLESNN